MKELKENQEGIFYASGPQFNLCADYSYSLMCMNCSRRGEYPTRAVDIVYPFSAGRAVDLWGGFLRRKLSKRWVNP